MNPMRRAVGHLLPGPPLLPAASRRLAAVAVAVCAVVTLVLALIVHGRATADGLDRVADYAIRHSIGSHRTILKVIVLPGTPLVATVLTAALVLACLVARRRRAAALVAIAAMAAPALTEFVLKPLVARKIGLGVGSFPSGHAAITFALAVSICVVLAQPPHRLRPALRVLLSVAALLAAAAVSVAMVALRRHYFTDIIGGAAIATAVVLLAAFALDWLGAGGGSGTDRTGGRSSRPAAGAHRLHRVP
jgi:membrane-associated phospholipid phosphatase